MNLRRISLSFVVVSGLIFGNSVFSMEQAKKEQAEECWFKKAEECLLKIEDCIKREVQLDERDVFLVVRAIYKNPEFCKEKMYAGNADIFLRMYKFLHACFDRDFDEVSLCFPGATQENIS